MPFFITDIFPYLKKNVQKKLEIQLNLVLKNSSQYEILKSVVVNIFKEKYVPKFKEILASSNNHLIKQIFLEGGFIEKDQASQYPYFEEIPLIEFQEYYYLPNELYYSILNDDFFLKERYLIGYLSKIPEKELKFWYQWQKEATEIGYSISEPLNNNLIHFYYFTLLNPISLPRNFFPKKIQYDFKEIFDKILYTYPFCLFYENTFSFYQTLRKLYFKEGKPIFLKIDQQKVNLKDVLVYFLSGKLVPLFNNKKLEKIYLTKELRDIEFTFDKKVLYLNTKNNHFI